MNNYSEEKAEIGSRIQEIRIKRHLTQEKLAEKADICSPQQMSNIERGSAGVSLPRFKNICKVLNIGADYLLFGFSAENAETVLHKYIEKMTPEQISILVNLVEVYAKSCGIDEI